MARSLGHVNYLKNVPHVSGHWVFCVGLITKIYSSSEIKVLRMREFVFNIAKQEKCNHCYKVLFCPLIGEMEKRKTTILFDVEYFFLEFPNTKP